jgi:hypothetical protein
VISVFKKIALALAVFSSVPISAQSTINARIVSVDGARLDTTVTDIKSKLPQGEVTFGTTAVDGADLRVEMKAACLVSQNTGAVLRLPAIRFIMGETCNASKIIGTPGKTVVVLPADFVKNGYGSDGGQFAFQNANFNTNFNSVGPPSRPAQEVLYKDFDVEVLVNRNISVFGLANVKSGLYSRVNIHAGQVLNTATGLPWPRDSLIDIYSAVKNFKVENSLLENITGANINAATPAMHFSSGGGSCIWVRNFSGNGTLPQNVTENIEITGNVCRHYTTDEALAVYGVRGTTRKINIHHNFFYGLLNKEGDNTAGPGGIYHNTFISVFPLNDGSGVNLGTTAAVYDVSFTDNYVEDRNFIYNVVRFGNSGDASNRNDMITSARNRIVAYQSNDATLGVVATWTAGGSPGGAGLSPAIAATVLRNIDGTAGTGFTTSFSGNTSTDDVVGMLSTAEGVGGGTINTAIGGFGSVLNPIVRGSYFTGVSNVANLIGGLVEVSGSAFSNVTNITGTRYRVLLSSGFVSSYTGTGTYSMSNTVGTSAGGFVRVFTGASSTTRVLLNGNTGTASVGYAITDSVAGATIVARMNDVVGVPSGVSTGISTYVGSLNRWGTIND